MNPVGLFVIAVGAFSLCGAGFDWEWFMNDRRARRLAYVLGRTGTRILYGVLGIAFVVLGILLTFGVIKNAR